MKELTLCRYTFSISVFLQLLVIISMSGAADHGMLFVVERFYSTLERDSDVLFLSRCSSETVIVDICHYGFNSDDVVHFHHTPRLHPRLTLGNYR